MRGDRALYIGFLPINFAHELLHVVAALPWAADWEVRINAGGDVEMLTIVDWDEGTPQWAIAMTHLAPLIAATIAAVLWMIGFAVGLVGHPAWWAAGALSLVGLWAGPSDDIAGAKAAIEGGDEV